MSAGPKTICGRSSAAAPPILGALYDAVAVGIKRLPTVKLSTLPRMADFARWGSAACPDLKTKSGQIVRFIDAYAGNREDTVEGVLEADPVAVAIRRFMADREEWQGIATELLVHLNGVVGEGRRSQRLAEGRCKLASQSAYSGGHPLAGDRHKRSPGLPPRDRSQVYDQARAARSRGEIASPASPASQDNTTNGLGGDTMTFANPRPAPPASRPPSQCNPLTNPKIDASDAGDAVFHTRSGSPSNDGIPDFLRRCDHCGQPSRTVEPLLPWDWEGRKILLHGRCETPWLESETPGKDSAAARQANAWARPPSRPGLTTTSATSHDPRAPPIPPRSRVARLRACRHPVHSRDWPVPDGRIAELFMNTAKHGTSLDVNARDAAVAASLLLQHGCPVETLRRALTSNGDGSASGPLARVLDIVGAG